MERTGGCGVDGERCRGPTQVSVFHDTIKAGFYVTLLQNGLWFNSVWGRSLNLGRSPPGEKKELQGLG